MNQNNIETITLNDVQFQVLKFFIDRGSGKSYLANVIKNSQTIDKKKLIAKLTMFIKEIEK